MYLDDCKSRSNRRTTPEDPDPALGPCDNELSTTRIVVCACRGAEPCEAMCRQCDCAESTSLPLSGNRLRKGDRSSNALVGLWCGIEASCTKLHVGQKVDEGYAGSGGLVLCGCNSSSFRRSLGFSFSLRFGLGQSKIVNVANKAR